jgi:hypothetical protein
MARAWEETAEQWTRRRIRDDVGWVVLVGCLLSAGREAKGEVNPLQQCTERTTNPGELALRCPGFIAYASIEQPAFSSDALAESLVRALSQSRHLRLEKAELLVDGVKRRGLRYAGDGVFGEGAMVPSSPDKVRFVGCEAPSLDHCAGVLAALLARLASAAPVAPSSDQPTFVGRTVSVPEGCSFQRKGPQSFIGCASANVSWVEAAADDPTGEDWVYGPLKQALATQGTLKERTRSCTVGGEKAQCHDLLIERAGKPSLNATATMARVRNQRVWVQCNVTGRDGDALPSPCSALLQLQ